MSDQDPVPTSPDLNPISRFLMPTDQEDSVPISRFLIPTQSVPTARNPVPIGRGTVPPDQEIYYPIPMFALLENVDSRVWFFAFSIGNLGLRIYQIQYLVPYGLNLETIHIPFNLALATLQFIASITNGYAALKTIHFYTVS
ncbi:unnamed protein product [Caenorhabditis sp. 36 PRJEB53466]|nr:unnamed protein product [Caenorhabditis sp. 36 PRJEB53466]